MQKSIVLIHGAWHDSSCFDGVKRQLSDQGYDVLAADLPLEGAEGDIRAARELIKTVPGCVVLGHSYGGLVITHASIDLEVSHLVYLAALMPGRGEDVNEVVGRYPSSALVEAMVVQDDGRLAIDPDKAIPAFYHDCEESIARAAAARLRPQTFAPFPVLDQEPAWRNVESTYVVCLDDKAQHPSLQGLFASRATSTVKWAGSHSPFLTQPARVAALLAQLASA